MSEELTGKKLVVASVATVKAGQNTEQGGVVVGRGLGLLEVVSLVGEVVVGVRPADDGPDEEIRVAALAAVPGVVPAAAADEGRVDLDGHDGGGPVVDLLRVGAPVAHHVAGGPGVVPEDVVHLRLGEGEQLRRSGGAAAAPKALPGGGQVVGVDGEGEGGGGDELEIIPPLAEQQPAGRPPHVAAPLPQAGAHEVFRLLLVALKNRRVLTSLPLQQELPARTVLKDQTK